MALGKDGNSKHSTSYKPYDASNSFVKKITDKVSGLIGWRTNSYDSGTEQNHQGSPSTSSTEDETVSPTPKRIKIQREVDAFKFTPKPASNEGCNSVSQINDISIAGPSYKAKCIASSTPAANCPKNSSSSTAANITDYLDNAPSNISFTLPTTSTQQRHNITVPAVHHKDMSNISTFDVNKSLSEVSSSAISHRQPSFNAELFSSSSKRLSQSVCENANRSCMSPFYSARTMYGGASALLPYSSQSMGRSRSASTSKLNVFSPKNQITIQPVPSPNKGANDQETMSTAARRILDTLEKYCSPVKDAKRIPINESPNKNDQDRPFTPRGVKRKLPALTQIMPSTTDLLRIKRQEKMQDSVLNARKAVSSVPQTFSAKDSDSSSDSADLDYSPRTQDPTDESAQPFKGKLKRKDANKFDDRPLAPLKLPNAVLKISNLPKFNITDDFTFSKPILPENLDTARDEPANATVSSSAKAEVVAKKTPKKDDEDDGKAKTTPKYSSPSKPSPSKGTSCENAKSFTFTSSNSKASQTTREHAKEWDAPIPSATKNNRWTCQKCLLENGGERCSSCSSGRPTNESQKRTESPQPKVTAAKSDGSGDVTNTTSSSAGETKDAKAESGEKATKSWSGDASKNLQKAPDDVWKCDVCWIQNKKTEAKCVACGEPNKSAPVAGDDKTAAVPKATFKFGFDKIETSSAPPTTFAFGANAPVSSVATSSTFTVPSFGIPKSASLGFGSASVSTSNAADDKGKPQATFNFGAKKPESPWSSPSTSFKSAANEEAKKTESTVFFNDVSSSTNNKKNNASFFKPTVPDAAGEAVKTFKLNATKEATNSSPANENGEEAKPAAAFNDITSSTNEVPNKKKTVSFASLFNKDASASNTNSVAGSNGIDGEFKAPASNALTAVSSSNNALFAANSSSPASMSFMSASKANETPSPALFSNATTNNTNDAGIFGTIATSTIGNTFAPLGNAIAKTETSVSNEAPKTNNIFASVGSTFNHNSFGVSSSQPSNTMFGASFGSLDSTKTPETSNAITLNPPAAINPAPAFRFGAMNAQTNTQPSGGFAFNGPKLDNATPKFGFGGTANNAFGSAGTQFVFGASTQQPAEAAGSVFSSGLKMGQTDGQMATVFKAPSAFGNTSVFGQPATNEAIKKPGGFNFSGFGAANVNDNQDMSRLNNSNAQITPATPFVFGSAPSQPTQQHNFNMTIPTSFNFNAGRGTNTGNAIPSFTAPPSATQQGGVQAMATKQAAPVGRKIKKAIRRTQKQWPAEEVDDKK